jgi:hypothetical protein
MLDGYFDVLPTNAYYFPIRMLKMPTSTFWIFASILPKTGSFQQSLSMSAGGNPNALSR